MHERRNGTLFSGEWCVAATVEYTYEPNADTIGD